MVISARGGGGQVRPDGGGQALMLKIGARALIRKVFTEKEVIQFAELSLDRNPLHLDKEVGKASIFGQRVVHGMLVASLFSGLIGMELPGKGSIYLGQTLTFKAPVFIGEAVTATVEIIKIRKDKPIVTLSTVCEKDSGQVVITGEAVVKVPEMIPVS
ncbi:MAG: MaoC family dehydratase [Nitrospiraceae bacterium]|nr:MAG: MaoC family dehydratase [Nitrospiraceae bacterium]